MSTTSLWHGLRLPADSTCAKYGMTVEDWKRIAKQQGYKCPVCRRSPTNGRLVVDHQHAYKWADMDPGVRRSYVRGLCCVSCNHFVLTRYGTIDKHRNAADYLEAYEMRRDHGKEPWE